VLYRKPIVMTQIEAARRGNHPRNGICRRRESIEADLIRSEVAAGRMVIPANKCT